MGETVGVDGRCVYIFHISHSYFNNPGDHGRLLHITGSSHHVYDSIHENEIGDSRGHGAISGSRSQEISQHYFHNDGESVDGDDRSVFRSQNSPGPSHHSCVLGISLGFNSYGHERSGYMFQAIQFSSYKHVWLYIYHPRLTK